MSVTTRADQLFSDAKDKIEDAARILLEACQPETWGSSEYKDDYIDEALKIAGKLLKMRRKL
jgi:formylmethanofuran dehydrogenase subunit B